MSHGLPATLPRRSRASSFNVPAGSFTKHLVTPSPLPPSHTLNKQASTTSPLPPSYVQNKPMPPAPEPTVTLSAPTPSPVPSQLPHPSQAIAYKRTQSVGATLHIAAESARTRLIERATKARLYLLHQSGPNKFLIGGDAMESRFHITIGPQVRPTLSLSSVGGEVFWPQEISLCLLLCI